MDIKGRLKKYYCSKVECNSIIIDPSSHQEHNHKLREIPNDLCDFDFKRKIGRGCYSYVFEIFDHNDQMSKALKLFENISYNHEIINQIEIEKKLCHQNIVRYFKSGKIDENTSYILEGFCENDLQQIMEKKDLKNFEEKKKNLKELCEGLQYLHNKNIIHGDLKPQNILIQNKIVQIADFSCSRMISNLNTEEDEVIGAPLYMPPELIKEFDYDAKIDLSFHHDIWRLGIIAHQIFTNGIHPFKLPKENSWMKNVREGIYKIDYDQIPKGSVIEKIITSCLKHNPEDRPNISDILNWINNSESLPKEKEKENKIKRYYCTQANCNSIFFDAFSHPEHDLSKIPKDFDRFDFKRKIDKGQFGYVFEIFDRSDNMSKALKVFQIQSEDDKIKDGDMTILKGLHHQNVVQYFESGKLKNDSEKAYLVLSLCETNLKKLMEQKTFKNFDEKLMIFKQICEGLQYLHSNKIIHCDFKPANILVNKKTIQISDFGTSKKINSGNTLTNILGTEIYMAPEVFIAYENEEQISAKCDQDIFSLGIIAHEIFTDGKHPFKHQGGKITNNIKQGKFIIDYGHIPKGSMLELIIKRCLELKPENRANISEILGLLKIIF